MSQRSHDEGSDEQDEAARRYATAEELRERDPRTGRSAAALRIQHQSSWVDLQIRQAQERGDFDDLPGAGKPIDELIGRGDDPDWWVKRLMERERITGLLPPALQLRKDDARLEERLDALTAEPEVRREVAEFNARIKHALLTNLGGPPVITAKRDVEAEVEAWTERRRARVAAQRAARAAAGEPEPEPGGAADGGRRRGLLRRLRPRGPRDGSQDDGATSR